MDGRRFHTIALIGKYQSPDIAETLLTLAAFLRDRGCSVLVETGTAESTGAVGFVTASHEEIGANSDLAIVVGGDGTMLNTARWLAEYDVPLVGVNLGRLGFLIDISREVMEDRIGDILDGRFRSERRALLQVDVTRLGQRVFRTRATNDVVLNKGEHGRMIEFDVRIDGEFVYSLRSDGMIVCTPTGSTAYALSANGPILHPAVSDIGLVPLCPHALSNRPIAIPDSSAIDINLIRPHDARVHFDGQSHCDVYAGDCIHITRSAHSITLLHPPGHSYFTMLREKLRWSEAPRNHSHP
jgi:NAD+ kinase